MVGVFVKGQTHFTKRKADVRFRWKTTMVHGEDKTSPQTIPFVSRSPWHVSVLVLICLLASPVFGRKIEPTHLTSLKTVGLAIGVVHPGDESPQPTRPAERFAFQPQTECRLMFDQLGKNGLGSGEALSQAELRGPLPRGSAAGETIRRCTRLTEIQLPRGIIVGVPAWWKGESLTLSPGQIPFVGCFS